VAPLIIQDARILKLEVSMRAPDFVYLIAASFAVSRKGAAKCGQQAPVLYPIMATVSDVQVTITSVGTVEAKRERLYPQR
jgi:hypothetical protein